ncbi:MAG: UDP-N-acetylmuramate:L-alanyl-gamma-D-glutamyl-meso-diaminopimelate ligase [Deltaproteobacteria bacterium]|nr:UDP-N-acetylmuramate:L-alanyl-gamma-D-glutamyl-meso-diaminopimelate ligase [Deltaproteobacteria bacterium]
MMSGKKVHLIGIGGSAMSNLALMFSELGWQVTGSDQNVYPPASTSLAASGIIFSEGYDASNIHSDLDLVIIGNVASRDNVEALATVRQNISYTSMAGALFDYFMFDKKRIAICGTHGKTTTTSLMAWVYQQAKMDPSYFVGGVPNNFKQGYGLGRGDHFIIEGDEYDTAYFEKTPKFLHYHPQHVVVTSIEFDHADIYRDFEHVYTQFEKLVAQIPTDGSLLACVEHEAVKKVAQGFDRVVTYAEKNAQWTFANQTDEGHGQSFDILRKQEKIMRVDTYLLGQHNRLNILSVVAQAHLHGLDMQLVGKAISSFKGVKKRQERIGEHNEVAIYVDFAHHPSAIATTIEGFLPMCKARRGRLIVALEPRSNTMRRKVFEKRLVKSFAGADMVCISQVFQKKDQLGQADMLSPLQVVEGLRSDNIEAFAPESTEALIDLIASKAKPHDIVLFMSNGSFEQAPSKLLQRLSA